MFFINDIVARQGGGQRESKTEKKEKKEKEKTTAGAGASMKPFY